MEMIELAIAIVPTVLFALHWGIIVGLGLRVILRRRSAGSSLAWMFLITSVPFLGGVIYLMIGELWLPSRRIKQALAGRELLRDVATGIEDRWELADDDLPLIARQLNAQSNLPFGLSALGGNSIELFDACNTCLDAMIRDIDHATQSVSMLFYIWHSKGKVEEVEDALIRACQRGVQCRVLLDSAGSRGFINSRNAQRLRQGGVELVEALPVGRFRFQLKRIDIRNHRKIVVIDHRVGYTGSMNMADPLHFNVGKGVGAWIDIMARVEGPVAQVMEMGVAMDWATEGGGIDTPSTHGFFESIREAVLPASCGDIAAQIVPSGPDQPEQLIHEMLITMIYNARKRLVITTPYFIPGEAMLQAIRGAAHRGVRVSLVVPERIDSVLVRHASKSYFEDLLDAGVEIYQYRGGLLHSKTVSADDEVSMLGSVNMDKRSFTINFEISMLVYHHGFLKDLRTLQESYIRDSIRIEPDRWRLRRVHERVMQNVLQLLSPLL